MCALWRMQTVEKRVSWLHSAGLALIVKLVVFVCFLLYQPINRHVYSVLNIFKYALPCSRVFLVFFECFSWTFLTSFIFFLVVSVYECAPEDIIISWCSPWGDKQPRKALASTLLSVTPEGAHPRDQVRPLYFGDDWRLILTDPRS